MAIKIQEERRAFQSKDELRFSARNGQSNEAMNHVLDGLAARQRVGELIKAEAQQSDEPEIYLNSLIEHAMQLIEYIFQPVGEWSSSHVTPSRVSGLIAQRAREEELACHQHVQDMLSGREQEVLRELARGASNRQIAETLIYHHSALGARHTAPQRLFPHQTLRALWPQRPGIGPA